MCSLSISLSCRLLLFHSPFFGEIRLIAHEDHDHIRVSLCPHVFYPTHRVCERGLVCVKASQVKGHNDRSALERRESGRERERERGGGKARLTCDVVHHDSYRGISNVARNQAPKPLLASSIPADAARRCDGALRCVRGRGQPGGSVDWASRQRSARSSSGRK